MRLTVAQRCGPLLHTDHSCGPVLPKCALLILSEEDMTWIHPVRFWPCCQRHMSAPFSAAKNISCIGYFLAGCLPTQVSGRRGDICCCAWDAGWVQRMGSIWTRRDPEVDKPEVIRTLVCLNLMLGHGPGLLHFFVHKLCTLGSVVLSITSSYQLKSDLVRMAS